MNSVMTEKTGLVLEGGGMRGLYTAGVLDYFLQENFFTDAVVGVSAGAVQACNFASRQFKRSARVYLTYIGDKRYLSWRSWWKTGDIFNTDFCYNRIPNELDPFDYETFAKSPMKFYAGVTDVETGKAAYLEIKDLRTQMDCLRASGSLPLVSNIVEVDGHKYLDGGIADSIPIGFFRSAGYGRNIVVLTREAGYRKKPAAAMPLIRWKYRKYPAFVQSSATRYIRYNETLDLLAELERKGEVFVIRPQKTVELGRLEKNPEKLKALYEEGFAEAKALFPKLLEFIGKR